MAVRIVNPRVPINNHTIKINQIRIQVHNQTSILDSHVNKCKLYKKIVCRKILRSSTPTRKPDPFILCGLIDGKYLDNHVVKYTVESFKFVGSNFCGLLGT